tara:strand:- start:915 stop:2168 length:1254 start_codon:yes stop_codon:yes gene_type:complete
MELRFKSMEDPDKLMDIKVNEYIEDLNIFPGPNHPDFSKYLTESRDRLLGLEDKLSSYLDNLNGLDSYSLFFYEGIKPLDFIWSKRSKTKYSKTAIILQGPISKSLARGKIQEQLCNSKTHKSELGIKLIKLSLERYSIFYPDSPKIISTWDTTDSDILEYLKYLASNLPNVYLLVSPLTSVNYDSYKTPSNAQIHSTNAGIELARKIGCEYILKSRTDMVFGADNFLDILHTLHLTHNKFLPSSLKGKIVVGSTNSFMARPYCLSDMFSFGFLDDMKLMWDLPLAISREPIDKIELHLGTKPLDQRMEPVLIETLKGTVHDVSARKGENYIFSNLIRRTGFDYSDSMDNYMKWIASSIIVVDNSILRIAWPKYKNTTMQYKYKSGIAPIKNFLDTKFRMNEWNYIEWLKIYNRYCP